MSEPSSSKVNVYWGFNNSPNPWSPNIADAQWIHYSDLVNLRIEQAYEKKDSVVSIGQYNVELSSGRMIQVSKQDPTKQRPVQRLEKGKSTSDHTRVNRFSYPDKPMARSLSDPGVWMSPFVEAWIKRNPNYKYKEEETIEQMALGLEREAQVLGENDDMETIGSLVRGWKELPRDEVIQRCVELYTADSWIYKTVNKTLRAENMDKVDTLGPFCCYVRSYLYVFQERNRGEIIVYRGMQLTQKDIDTYKESMGEVKSWLAFASTSTEIEGAEDFLSTAEPGKIPTLFIISYESDSSQYFPGRDISSLSIYGHEKEVLLHPGADFRIEKVKQNIGVNHKTIIYLTLM